MGQGHQAGRTSVVMAGIVLAVVILYLGFEASVVIRLLFYTYKVRHKNI